MTQNTLANAKPEINVADIVRHGDKLILPEKMTLGDAAVLIKRRMEYESQKTQVQEAFNCFPLDGAVQLDWVLNDKYGWAPAVATPGFFRDNPPTLISVAIGPHETKQVPWGRFLLPNVEGHIDCGVTMKGNRYCFQLSATMLRRDEPEVRALFNTLRDRINSHSIYRGKAIRINFLDSDGDAITNPEPTFLDTEAVEPEMLILSEHVYRAVNTSLFTPIRRTADCFANGIPVKRGILLGGTFGTGKTLIAHVASKHAVDAGITFLYIQKAEELPQAIEFARQYQSPACVIFCEDIDREMDGERDEDMDEVLNTIDGIDSKTSNIIVVLTTNEIGKIHPAMLRPGRLDAVIDVTPPDGPAIERLVRAYAKGALDPNESLVEVGKVLNGNIPAVIAEVVKRAKLAQLALQEPGTMVKMLTASALLESAQTIQAQVELLKPKVVAVRPPLEGTFVDLMREAVTGIVDERLVDTVQTTSVIDSNVKEIRRKVS